MRRLSALLIGVAASCMWLGAAQAQSNNIMVVSSCGAQSFPVSTSTLTKLGILTEDTTGNLCTSATGGGGGGAVTVANGADTAEGSTTDAPCTLPASTTACTMEAVAKAVANAASSAIPAGTNTIGTTGYLPYPVGAVPITASATGTTGATTATLTNVSGHTTYICGYSIRANATANTNVTDTVTGVITGTLSSILWVPANTVGLGVDEQIFSPCIPASAVSTSIAVVSGAPGTGGLVSVKAWGYSL